jgi:hypothetical protein
MIAAAAMLACLPAISALAANKSETASHTFEAEAAEHIGGAATLADATASGGLLAAVSSLGHVEWGSGREAPSFFNPTELDANQ